MERVTPGQRPRPNYGHPQGPAAEVSDAGAWLVACVAGGSDFAAVPGDGCGICRDGRALVCTAARWP